MSVRRCPFRIPRSGLALTATIIGTVAACGKGAGPSPAASTRASPVGSGASTLAGPLPSRPLVVARADQLAVLGSRDPSAAGAKLLWEAATLRARLYRLESRKADGLEAVELFRTVGDRKGNHACEARLRGALLRAEVEGDPSLVFGALPAKGACAERTRRAERLLAALRPSPTLGLTPAAPIGTPSAALALPPAPSAVPDGPPRLLRVDPLTDRDAARVILTLNRPVRYKVGTLDAAGGKKPRLYVDLPGVSFTGKRAFPGGGLLSGIRRGKRQQGARVVLDVEGAFQHRVFHLPEPYRVVVDVVKASLVNRRKADGNGRRVRRVVLDPGHGGHDPGAVGPSGLREKDVTLDIAHRAAPLIARELGIVTLLTRDSDVYVGLPERTARANAFNADLFVSIHCNSDPEGSGRGVMTFVLDRTKDSRAAAIAARENDASEAAGAALLESLDRLVGKENRRHSAAFAGLLQRAAIASLASTHPSLRDRGVAQAGFYVLAGARMPAVLFETSFISEPVEERLLASATYRQQLADSIVNAVRAYRAGR